MVVTVVVVTVVVVTGGAEVSSPAGGVESKSPAQLQPSTESTASGPDAPPVRLKSHAPPRAFFQ